LFFSEKNPALLRTLLRSRWDPDRLAWIESDLRLHADLDWVALIDVAQQARVAPLIYLVLREKAWLPTYALDRLRMFYFATARRNLLAFNALARVIEHLNAHDIPNLLLKGVALTLTLYKNEALRPMGDVDVLVRREDVEHTLALLRELDYDTPIPEVRAGARLAYDGELFVQPGVAHAAPIDLHWNLINAPNYRHSPAEQWLWDSAQPVVVGHAEGRVLCPEAQLIHLCAHKVLHHSGEDATGGALWGFDIALLLSEQTLDWDVVLTQAQALDMIAPLQMALPAVVREWGELVPEAVLAHLPAFKPSRTERRLLRWRASEHKRTGARGVWANIQAMPNVWAALRYVWSMLFPSVRYMREHYGMSSVLLLPVYYVRRWVRGLGGTT